MNAAYEQHVHAFLANQRWFAGKDRDFRIADVHRLEWLSPPGASPAVRVELVEVAYGGADDDDQRETYQLPVSYYGEPQDRLGHALVGEWEDAELGRVVAYDAPQDREATPCWLRALAEQRSSADMRFHRSDWSALPIDEPSLVLSGEQSNTSLVFGEAALLKVFRKLAPGRNPDIEIHAALAGEGSEEVAELLGWVEASWSDSDGARRTGDVAMLQRFLRTATNGWELALTSVRDLFAEGDLHADEVGGDFAAEAFRLGATTAQVHTELARSFPTSSWSAGDLSLLAEAMRTRLAEAQLVAPELEPFAPMLLDIFAGIEPHPAALPVQRVHGDLHLGQAMRTVAGWKLIDFEGEPARPLEQRSALDSPLRDVAGMLRSFDYAAHVLGRDQLEQQQIAYRAVEWADRNRDAFCAGYADLRSDPRDEPALLCAYEADKVVYEVAYEKRNRPSWLEIPLGSLGRIAAQRRSGSA
jgi:maltokinase